MSTDAVAVIGFVALFTLMLLRVPVGMAMGLVGVSGFAYLVNGSAALKLVGATSMRTVTDYTFGVIPMFLLMGTFVSNSGMSRDLFKAANGFVGHLRGGLGFATVAACGAFAAISGAALWHGRSVPCPPDLDVARSCRRLRRISALLYGLALASLLLGGTFAFVLPALNE